MLIAIGWLAGNAWLQADTALMLLRPAQADADAFVLSCLQAVKWGALHWVMTIRAIGEAPAEGRPCQKYNASTKRRSCFLDAIPYDCGDCFTVCISTGTLGPAHLTPATTQASPTAAQRSDACARFAGQHIAGLAHTRALWWPDVYRCQDSIVYSPPCRHVGPARRDEDIALQRGLAECHK